MTAQPSEPLPRPDDVAGDRRARGRPGGRAFRAALRSGRIKAEHVRDYGIVVFVIALFIYFSVASPVFLTAQQPAQPRLSRTRPSASPPAPSR